MTVRGSAGFGGPWARAARGRQRDDAGDGAGGDEITSGDAGGFHDDPPRDEALHETAVPYITFTPPVRRTHQHGR